MSWESPDIWILLLLLISFDWAVLTLQCCSGMPRDGLQVIHLSRTVTNVNLLLAAELWPDRLGMQDMRGIHV